MSEGEIHKAIAEARESLKRDPKDFWVLIKLVENQYWDSWGIRGDNTPENAAYLGYLDAKDLYPDFKGITLAEYYQEIIEGKGRAVYS